LGRKDLIWRHVSRMRRIHGSAFNIHPQSFLLPEEGKCFMEARQANPKGTWIYKPSSGSCGRGIRLVTGTMNVEKLLKKQGVIQRYLGSPLLINGYKFDLRLYVAVTSLDPLKIWMYQEGLVRFATEKYSCKSSTMKKTKMHLTNYSLNKDSENYVKNMDSPSPKRKTKGRKQSLSEVETAAGLMDISHTVKTPTSLPISPVNGPTRRMFPRRLFSAPSRKIAPLKGDETPLSGGSLMLSPTRFSIDTDDALDGSPDRLPYYLSPGNSPMRSRFTRLEHLSRSRLNVAEPLSPNRLPPVDPTSPTSSCPLSPVAMESEDESDESFKWSLEQLKTHFDIQGWNWDATYERIEDLVTKCMLAVEPTLVTCWHQGTTFRSVGEAQPKTPNQNCVEVYGFDVLIGVFVGVAGFLWLVRGSYGIGGFLYPTVSVTLIFGRNLLRWITSAA